MLPFGSGLTCSGAVLLTCGTALAAPGICLCSPVFIASIFDAGFPGLYIKIVFINSFIQRRNTMSVRIIIDSAADIPSEQATQKWLELLPGSRVFAAERRSGQCGTGL